MSKFFSNVTDFLDTLDSKRLDSLIELSKLVKISIILKDHPKLLKQVYTVLGCYETKLAKPGPLCDCLLYNNILYMCRDSNPSLCQKCTGQCIVCGRSCECTCHAIAQGS